MILKAIFYLPGILFVISGVPQVIKLLRTKSSKDISIWMYLITDVAISIVVVDAFIHKNTSILISNLLSLVSTLFTTFLIMYYRKK